MATPPLFVFYGQLVSSLVFTSAAHLVSGFFFSLNNFLPDVSAQHNSIIFDAPLTYVPFVHRLSVSVGRRRYQHWSDGTAAPQQPCRAWRARFFHCCSSTVCVYRTRQSSHGEVRTRFVNRSASIFKIHRWVISAISKYFYQRACMWSSDVKPSERHVRFFGPSTFCRYRKILYGRLFCC